jgi:glycosyltransferase involved in cell wall biosynthesis
MGQDARPGNGIVKWMKPEGKRIIALSDFLQRTLENNYGIRPFTVIENGVNNQAFPPFNEGERTIDLLGAGSLTELKNYGLFIDILAEVKKKRPGIRAVLAGGGPEEENLRRHAAGLQLEPTLEFMGTLPHSRVLELMSRAKIFVHTSHYEGNATVLIEALHSGCFVVSTQPLSDSGTKNLVVCGKKEDMATCILNRLGTAGNSAERVTFNTMDDSAKKIMALFE